MGGGKLPASRPGRHAFSPLRGKTHGIHLMGGCEIPEVGLDVLEPAAARNRTPDHSAPSYSLSRPTRPISMVKDPRKIHFFTICIIIVLQPRNTYFNEERIWKIFAFQIGICLSSCPFIK